MTVVIHGIRNCDTMKKARSWLDAKGIAHTFHDYKVSGIDAARLERWCSVKGWDVILNKSGTTFRGLPEAARADLDQNKAIALMLANPSMIKRPVLEIDGDVVVGFKPDIYAALFG